MLPPSQRLEGRDRAGRERDDGLIVDDDLVALERAPQLDRELLPLAEALVEPRLVDRVVAALVAFATYIAMSALRSSSSPVTAFSPVSAMPMLASALVSRPDSQNGSASASRIRCATSSASAASVSVSRTANSSPPSRAGVSPGRIA